MKGPGMRLDLDVRRVWQCPACGRQARSTGRVVSKTCDCTKEPTPMRLVELPRPKPTVRIPDSIESEPDMPELADFPTDIPVNPPSLSSPRSLEAAGEESRSDAPFEPPSPDDAGPADAAT